VAFLIRITSEVSADPCGIITVSFDVKWLHGSCISVWASSISSCACFACFKRAINLKKAWNAEAHDNAQHVGTFALPFKTDSAIILSLH
jgi:hypothetical protein